MVEHGHVYFELCAKKSNSMQKVVNSVQITLVAMQTNGVVYENFVHEKNSYAMLTIIADTYLKKRKTLVKPQC